MASTINAATSAGGGLIQSADASGILQLQTAGTAALTIDGSQNVSIGASGATSSRLFVQNTDATTWAADTSVAQVQVYNATSTNNGTALFGAAVNYGDTTYTGVKFGAVATGSYSASMVFATRSAGTFYERMRIDSSGNVGIGTSSPSYKLDVNANARIGSGSGQAVLFVAGGNSGSSGGSAVYFQQAGTTGFAVGNYSSILGGAYNADAVYYLGGSNNHIWTTGGSTERMRIDSSGNLIVATGGSSITAGGGTPRFSMNYSSNSGAGYTIQDTNPQSGNTFIRFVNAGTVGGAITSNGGTTMTYGSASDYRLKENLAPLTGALAKVAQLQPKVGNWKADGSDFIGFIAHELQEVFPDAVVGEKDKADAEGNPHYQMVDTGSASIIATLTAAIQEQQALITTLTERITALEAK